MNEHYKKGSIQPKDFIMANDLGFCEGNVVKYITRYKHKGTPLEDLRKAQEYIQFLIDAIIIKETTNDSSKALANIQA